MAIHKLTQSFVRAVSTPGRYGDGGGLLLQVSPSKTKSWLFRYSVSGVHRHMGLGSLDTISLTEAREMALQARKQLLHGHDPLEAKRAGRSSLMAARSKQVTFQWCAEQYIASHEKTWKHPKHAQQWPNSLKAYCYPDIGALVVQDIETAHILKCIGDIWKTKTETASRVRMRLETILSWATARGYRKGENPARWKGHLDQLLPKRSKVTAVEHHKALPYPEMPVFMQALRLQQGMAARALEFCILAASRTSETLNAEWSEIDTVLAVWTIPAVRMKAGKEHKVALSGRMVDMLGSLPREGRYVFAGATKGRPLSNMSMLQLLRRMDHHELTVHGFRSSFRDWAAEQTAYPSEVAEMALAHVVGDKTEAAYRRGDLLEKRRRLTQDWCNFASGAGMAGHNVVPLRGAL
jgi:integrase